MREHVFAYDKSEHDCLHTSIYINRNSKQ